MIKAYIVKEGCSIDGIFEGHAIKDLIQGYARANIDCDNGYFLTFDQLAELKRETVEEFSRCLVQQTNNFSIVALTRTYETTKKDGEG